MLKSLWRLLLFCPSRLSAFWTHCIHHPYPIFPYLFPQFRFCQNMDTQNICKSHGKIINIQKHHRFIDEKNSMSRRNPHGLSLGRSNHIGLTLADSPSNLNSLMDFPCCDARFPQEIYITSTHSWTAFLAFKSVEFSNTNTTIRTAQIVLWQRGDPPWCLALDPLCCRRYGTVSVSLLMACRERRSSRGANCCNATNNAGR